MEARQGSVAVEAPDFKDLRANETFSYLSLGFLLWLLQLRVQPRHPSISHLFFFAFTTILAYYYIAETNIAYLRRTIKIPGMMLRRR